MSTLSLVKKKQQQTNKLYLTSGPRIPDRIGIWKCWFLRRGENRRTRRKTSRSKDENQQQTQPTFDAESGNRTRATLVGGLRGRQMLNHCAIPAPIPVRPFYLRLMRIRTASKRANLTIE